MNKEIMKKLFTVEEHFKTFAATEDSAAKDAKDRSSYKYTPGWTIVEQMREEWRKQGLKLLPNVISESHQMVDYPVYKLIDGKITSFTKKEMCVFLTVEYTWYDTQSGECSGPWRQISSGANGIDKSTASAMSLNERYFLLKFFQVTTRETSEEADAYDPSMLPGISLQNQPENAPLNPTYTAQRSTIPTPGPMISLAPANPVPVAMPAPRTAPAPQPVQMNAMPQQQVPTTAPSKTAAQAGQAYHDAITSLAFFEPGTQTFNEILEKHVKNLQQCGYDVNEPTFRQRLIDGSRSIRNNA